MSKNQNPNATEQPHFQELPPALDFGGPLGHASDHEPESEEENRTHTDCDPFHRQPYLNEDGSLASLF